MSVTIVSTLPAQPQPAESESAPISNSATSGEDFASLLLGQLAPIVPESLPETTVQTDLPADSMPGDPASLLAALGLVTPNPVATTETSLPNVGKSDKTALNALAEIQTTANAGPDFKTKGQAGSLTTGPALIVTPAADDKAARFAVPAFVAPGAEPIMAKTILADNLPSTISEPAGNIPLNAQNLPLNRDISLPLSTPVRDQSWSADFAQKIVWLATSDKQSAQLTLNPPHMGPIEISLNIDKSNASASFVSANAEVRDAIEMALPRLREMFASAGIELGQTNVSAESFRQQSGNGEGQRSSSQRFADNAILGADSAGSLSARVFSVKQGNGLVDIFA
jgi:flagellar hook-length control protein FliK